MAKTSFGKAIGELILKKRKILGLTQLQLAEDALGSGKKVRRISELENGVVANPHPKTIDPIISTLGISDVEIEQLLSDSESKADDSLAIAYAEASKLIDDLARKFEIEYEDAGFEELDSFLRAKADEYLKLKKGIEEISALDEEIVEVRNKAISELNEGNFSDVDLLLIKAEELQLSNKTLAEIKKQSEIRVLRADSMFLKGDVDESFNLYSSAALFFEPFDPELMVDTLHNLAGRIYEQQRRSFDANYVTSRKLLELSLSKSEDLANRIRTGNTHYRLSLIYRNEASICSTPKVEEELLSKAIHHAREAVKIMSLEKDSFKIYSSQISLGNCLSQLTYLTADPVHAENAINVLNDTRSKINENQDHLDLLSHVCNSLGAAILRFHKAKDEGRDDLCVTLAIEAYEEAIHASNHVYDLEVWGSANINLGRLFADKSRSKSIEAYQSAYLRVRSIACFQAAIETYPENLFPDAFAEAHFGIAETLYEHGFEYGRQADFLHAELYFGRAIESFSRATIFFTEENFPERWADIQSRIGAIFGTHASFPDTPSQEDDFEKALGFLNEGLRVYKKLKAVRQIDYCEKTIEKLSELKTDSGC